MYPIYANSDQQKMQSIISLPNKNFTDIKQYPQASSLVSTLPNSIYCLHCCDPVDANGNAPINYAITSAFEMLDNKCPALAIFRQKLNGFMNLIGLELKIPWIEPKLRKLDDRETLPTGLLTTLPDETTSSNFTFSKRSCPMCGYPSALRDAFNHLQHMYDKFDEFKKFQQLQFDLDHSTLDFQNPFLFDKVSFPYINNDDQIAHASKILGHATCLKDFFISYRDALIKSIDSLNLYFEENSSNINNSNNINSMSNMTPDIKIFQYQNQNSLTKEYMFINVSPYLIENNQHSIENYLLRYNFDNLINLFADIVRINRTRNDDQISQTSSSD
ncbi:hypothetical protein GJ496_008934 [Pomphorhynchus laevis]|nr:hypothetical protein GJ496_008934 [Pomphorhynchus laevis]